MDSKKSFGRALKLVREWRNLSQDDFSEVSGRTYLSSLERGLKSPTLEKLIEISSVLNVHPLTLVAQSFISSDSPSKPDEILELVRSELEKINH